MTPEPTTPPDTTVPVTTAPVTTAPAIGPGSVPATTDLAATTVDSPASVRPLAARDDALARTGAPIGTLAGLGAGLILMGAIVLTARRRTS